MSARRKRSFWEFIKTNILSLSTVFTGFIALILNQLKLIPDTYLPAVMLVLLLLLATTEIVDKRIKLEKLEDDLYDIHSKISDMINGIEVLTFKTSFDALNYLEKITVTSQIKIDQASIDKQRQPSIRERNQYVSARDDIIKSNRIKYRYIGVISDSKSRLEWAKEFIIINPVSNFFAGFHKLDNSTMPQLSFTIIDDNEVFTRAPFGYGGDGDYIAIKNKTVVKFFRNYFEQVWEPSIKVKNQKDYDKLQNI